jgi:hypothetical protein
LPLVIVMRMALSSCGTNEKPSPPGEGPFGLRWSLR